MRRHAICWANIKNFHAFGKCIVHRCLHYVGTLSRPGHCNVPWAPNLADEAIPSHPLPTMGGASTPTTNHTKSARANDQDPCLPMSSTSPLPMTLDITFSLPPTLHHRRWHFNLLGGGGVNYSFRDNGEKLPPRKCPQRK